MKSECLSDSGDNRLVLFDFVTESNMISLANTRGEINLINMSSKSVSTLHCTRKRLLTQLKNTYTYSSTFKSNFYSQVEIVGSIPDGLAAAQWSPDQELLVLVTGINHNLMYIH